VTAGARELVEYDVVTGLNKLEFSVNGETLHGLLMQLAFLASAESQIRLHPLRNRVIMLCAVKYKTMKKSLSQ